MPSRAAFVAGSAAARPVDRVVALPVLTGRPISGLPATVDGFIPVDAAGRVEGVPGVFAAGDGTDGAIKQGGVAAQQADRAVATMLAEHGVDVPAPADPPALNALPITGADTWYLRRRADSSRGEISARPLWWPPSKVVGRHLSPFLDALRDGAEPGTDTGRGPARRRRLTAQAMGADAAWAALRDAYPRAGEQRCRVQKIGQRPRHAAHAAAAAASCVGDIRHSRSMRWLSARKGVVWKVS